MLFSKSRQCASSLCTLLVTVAFLLVPSHWLVVGGYTRVLAVRPEIFEPGRACAPRAECGGTLQIASVVCAKREREREHAASTKFSTVAIRTTIVRILHCYRHRFAKRPHTLIHRQPRTMDGCTAEFFSLPPIPKRFAVPYRGAVCGACAMLA